MTVSKSLKAAACAAILLGAASAASAADVVYTFDQKASAASFGTGPYGTVSLTQSGADVSFEVVLRGDLNFVTTGNVGSKAVFAFNAAGVAAGDIVDIVDASNQTFSVVAPGNDSPFGSFTFGIVCATNCSNGGSAGGYPDPLSFTVKNAVLADFASTSTGGTSAYFAADVITSMNVGANTGAIGVTGAPVVAVPEPETYALMLGGLGIVGFIAKRRKPRA